MESVKIVPVGDRAAEILFPQEVSEENLRRVMAAAHAAEKIPGVGEPVPGYASLLLTYDPCKISYPKLEKRLQKLLHQRGAAAAPQGSLIEIPVCYGGCFGEDLPLVAAHCGMTEGQVIHLHSSKAYRIHFLGFLPGFPYLGGLDAALETPRRKTPRTLVPKGSVGIGGAQTGIYPFASPGGWQLIGRTPLNLFDHQRGVAYKAGDSIRFVPIDAEEFHRLEGLSLWDWK